MYLEIKHLSCLPNEMPLLHHLPPLIWIHPLLTLDPEVTGRTMTFRASSRDTISILFNQIS